MSSFGLFLVVTGVFIIATRGPLIVAPLATRSLYMNVLKTDARMRGWGVIAALLGAIAIWVSGTASGAAAAIAFYLGVFVVIAGLGSAFLFPSQFRRLAENIWSSFSGPVLRGLGLISVAFGALLIYYGLSL